MQGEGESRAGPQVAPESAAEGLAAVSGIAPLGRRLSEPLYAVSWQSRGGEADADSRRIQHRRSSSVGWWTIEAPVRQVEKEKPFVGGHVLARASHSMPLDALLENYPTSHPLQAPPSILEIGNPFLKPDAAPPSLQTGTLDFCAPSGPTEALESSTPVQPTFRSRGSEPPLQFPLNPQSSMRKTSSEAGRPALRSWQSFDEASFAARERLLEALDSRQRRPSLGLRLREGDAALDTGSDPMRDLGSVWQSYEEPQECASFAGSDGSGSQVALTGQQSRRSGGGLEAGVEAGKVPKWAAWKLPGRLATWQFFTGHTLKPGLLKTAFFAAWAVGVMGVLPFVNTISNAWFIAILYSPRVLECINFVEQSPGADPSEFPTISGTLLQALSWICVILGVFDIGDIVTRLGLHLYKQGIPVWRFRLFTWTAIKWLMVEDEASTHIGGYTHARLREFLFSSGADSVEIFVTASFLFWTGSGYPLATLSLFTSLLSIYLAWSFEISWHLWYLGRRFLPFWPHPTAGRGPHGSSRTLLLGNEASAKNGWFRRRRKPAECERPSMERNAQDIDRNKTSQDGGDIAGGGNQQHSELRGPRLEAGGRERNASFEAIDVDAFVSDTVDCTLEPDYLEEHAKGPANVQGDGFSVVIEGGFLSQDGVSGTGNSRRQAGNQNPAKRADGKSLERGYSSDLQRTWEGPGQAEIRHRRTRSLENTDVQVAILRTLSQASERILVSANQTESTTSPRSRLGVRRNSVLIDDADTARTASDASLQGATDPPSKDDVGRGERYLFRAIRGVVLLGMVLAVVIALWLADFGPGVLYGVGITYLTRISTQVHVRCEPFAARGTFVDYVLPFNGSPVLNLDGVFFYYTAASNAYIFDTSDDELSSITEHDFVVGAVADPFVAYVRSSNTSSPSSGSIKVRFATVLRGVAMLVTTSDAWAREMAGQENTTASIVLKKKLPPLPLSHSPLNQRLVYKYNTQQWQTQSVPVHNFGVPVYCRSPYDNATASPLGRLIALNASISMAGVSCYNPGNATFKLPEKKKPYQSKTSTFY